MTDPVDAQFVTPKFKDLHHMKVVVHPLVLLSVVDHWQRAAKNTKKRVVGAILGEVKDDELHCTNSFAVPFEEDAKDPAVSFLDGLYTQQMAYMFKKINTKERFVGWYATGTNIKSSDLHLHRVFKDFAGNVFTGVPPVFCLVNVADKVNESALPVKVYYQTSVPCCDDRFLSTFQLMSRCEIKGSEAEEVAVEHLIRDVKETHALSFKGQLQGHHGSIKEYANNLAKIKTYLDGVASGQYTANQEILNTIQDILSKIPDFNATLIKEGHEQTANDGALMQYIGSLTMAVISLHDLLDNRSKTKPKLSQTKQIVDHTS